MGIHLGRVGHIGIHVSDVDRSIDFYRRVLGLKLTGRWGPPDIGRPICFMRIDDKYHDVVLFELPEDARKAGVAVTDSSLRRATGLDQLVGKHPSPAVGDTHHYDDLAGDDAFGSCARKPGTGERDYLPNREAVSREDRPRTTACTGGK
jgi:catechol 2,3-dioxygenase-like lactoylglutathione lyase family enzyme